MGPQFGTKRAHQPAESSGVPGGDAHFRDQLRTHELLLYPNLLRALPELPNLDLLDAGCGDGTVAEMVRAQRPTWRIHAGDVDDAAVAHARTRLGPEANIFHLDLRETFPLASRSIDVAETICALMWLDPARLQDAFKEFYRILRPGGRLVMIDPHPEWQRRKLAMGDGVADSPVAIQDSWDGKPVQVWWRPIDAYQAAAAAAGFRVSVDSAAIPRGLSLAPRYADRVGENLYLILLGEK